MRASWDTTAGKKLFEEAEKSRRRQSLRCASACRSPMHMKTWRTFVKTTVSELKKKKACRRKLRKGLRCSRRKRSSVSAAVCQGTGRNRERDDTGEVRTTDCWRFSPLNGRKPGRRRKSVRSSKNAKQTGRLSEEYVAAINVYKIRAFLQTLFGACMAKELRSNRLHRERPCGWGFGKPFKYRLSGG